MSWLDLAVQVVPDSLIQRAKALQETLRFEQVEKERQARLEEEIGRKRKGAGNGKGEKPPRQRLTSSETQFGRRGPSRSIVRRPIGNNGLAVDFQIATGYINQVDSTTSSVITVYSGDGSDSVTTTLTYFDFPTVPDPSSAWLAGLNEDPTKPAGAIWSDVPTEGHAANALADPNRRTTTSGTISGTGTRSFRNEVKIGIYNYGLQYFYSLPVSGDDCLLVYVAKGDKGFTRLQCGWDVDYAFSLVASDAGLNTYELVDNASYVDPVSTFYSDQYNYKRCWLISKSSVRAVAVPSGIAARLDAMHEVPTRGTLTLSTTSFFVDPPPSLPWPPASTTVTAITASPSEAATLYGPVATNTQLSPLLSYGLIPKSISSDIYGAPSIFSYLTGFSKADAPGLDGSGNYEAARATYFSTAPAPSASFLRQCMLAGTCDVVAGIYGFDQTITTPASVSAALALSSSGYEESPYPTVTNTLPGLGLLTRVAAWDWGKPDYCRQQLVELGFSIEDLTP
jgi:hypothetical protein